MTPNKSMPTTRYGDEAPRWKDFLIVIMIFLFLIALDWIAYFKLGWLH